MSGRNTRSSTRNASRGNPPRNPPRNNPRRNNPNPEHLLGPPFDRERFVGPKAQKFFMDYSHRNCNVEKEFQYADMDLDGIFEYYGWKRLAKRPAFHGVSNLVKEFYANAFENGKASPNSVVRGVQVDYLGRTINELYGLGDPEECEYEELIENIHDIRPMERKRYELLQDTFPDFDPDEVQRGYIMKSSELSLRMRALHRFICERILPSTHYNEVHYTRAALMKVALNRGHINTGNIIRREIQATFKGMGTANFNYPLLITRLMVRAGLDLTLMPKDLVPGATVSRQSLTTQSHPKPRVGSTSGAQPMVEEEEEEFQEEEFEEEEFEEEEENQGADEGDREIHPDEATYYMSGLVDNLVEDFGNFRVEVNQEFAAHNQWRGNVDASLMAMQQQQMELRESQLEMRQQMNTEFEAARAWREQRSREAEQQNQLLQMMWARLAPPPQLPPPNQGGWDHYYHPRPPPQ